MSDEEYAKANAVWRELRKDYGDEVALKRAKNRWRQVRSEATGSHVGGATGPWFTPGAGEAGARIQVEVRAERSGYTPGTRRSMRTAPVAP